MTATREMFIAIFLPYHFGCDVWYENIDINVVQTPVGSSKLYCIFYSIVFFDMKWTVRPTWTTNKFDLDQPILLLKYNYMSA